MEVYAVYKKANSSAQKVRIVSNLILGKKVSSAINILQFNRKKSSNLVIKVLNSAIANAEHNYGLDVDKLKVIKIFVDEGPVMKRMMPRAKGRADRILKRTSHIKIVISD
ncbi:50S ribosomal protein L22 [Buchnera aphidicola (Ceratoglyphina bambusae)]|uniref:50S ribosomal protein L22 n=1 Tax=Buchnera aphidicola TaxID=9 RepID=UPI0031B81826